MPSLRTMVLVPGLALIVVVAVLHRTALAFFDPSTPGSYYSRQLKDNAPANADPRSDEFPHLFVNCDGSPVDLTQYSGRSKIVLVVLRGMPKSTGGAFCPMCVAQASTLTANRQQFVDRGAEVLVVYPGPTERLGEFLRIANRSDTDGPSRSFQVLIDPECTACDRLGIRADLAKPSTYVLDTRGAVVYAYVGVTTTDRPSVKAILTQLENAK